ncbi:hypothetical protein B0H14DRAFT_2180979, partial [Mycena olivaceomarginata]
IGSPSKWRTFFAGKSSIVFHPGLRLTPVAHGFWVIAVVPCLLYCFLADHSLETCEKIYKAHTRNVLVALAFWNQVGSE